MQLKHSAILSVTAIALGLGASASSAAVINFDQSNAQSPTGSIAYGGDNGVLTGSGISFNEIRLEGTDSVLRCESCSITFQTGPVIREGGPGDKIWSFEGGGNFALEGSAVDSSGNTIASGALFSGVFNSSDRGSPQLVTGNGANNLIATLTGRDDFNADLANYFGLTSDADFDFSTTDIALGNATFGGDGSFNSGQLVNADVAVQTDQQPGQPGGQPSDVPEPSAFGIFTLGMALMLTGLVFRRKSISKVV